MGIVNRSSQLYGGANNADASFQIALVLGGDFLPEVFAPFADSSFDGNLTLGGDFAPVVFNPFADASFDGALELGGDFAPEAYTPGDVTFDGNLTLGGDFLCDTALVLVEPEPIVRTVAAGAFTSQRYAPPKLFINDVAVPFLSAEIGAPGKTLGKTLAVELAKADLAQLPNNATFRLEIYKRAAGGAMQTHVLLDGGKLTSRNYRMASGRDGLSISLSDADSRLDKCPKDNLIVYDPNRGEVSTEEIETIRTNTNEVIATNKRAVPVLTLKKLLDIAYLEGCGFASVDTDIPNYEIARGNFSVTNSYSSSVAPFIGMYEPLFKVEGNNLVIQKTINPLPSDYEPNELLASRYPSFTETAEYPSANIDGYTLLYTGTQGITFVDRTEPAVVEPVGDAEFGDIDFVEESTTRKYRDWFEPDNPVPVRTELKQEIVETRQNGVVTGRETKTNLFDALGRSKGYTNTIEARMPDVAAGDVPSLLKTHEQSQTMSYGSNPFAPRQTVLRKVETTTKTLVAFDEENTALDQNGEDAPYGQDYEKVFEAGNLKSGMTASFRATEVETFRFRPLRDGTVEVRLSGFDFLRGKPKKPSTDIRSGDISTPNFQKQQIKTIFKTGVTQAARTGKPLPSLNTGELPLVFAEPVASWILANGRVKGNIEVTGYDESIERGISFTLRGRGGENLGRFIVEGYRISITTDSIKTTLDALRV